MSAMIKATLIRVGIAACLLHAGIARAQDLDALMRELADRKEWWSADTATLLGKLERLSGLPPRREQQRKCAVTYALHLLCRWGETKPEDCKPGLMESTPLQGFAEQAALAEDKKDSRSKITLSLDPSIRSATLTMSSTDTGHGREPVEFFHDDSARDQRLEFDLYLWPPNPMQLELTFERRDGTTETRQCSPGDRIELGAPPVHETPRWLTRRGLTPIELHTEPPRQTFPTPVRTAWSLDAGLRAETSWEGSSAGWAAVPEIGISGSYANGPTWGASIPVLLARHSRAVGASLHAGWTFSKRWTLGVSCDLLGAWLDLDSGTSTAWDVHPALGMSYRISHLWSAGASLGHHWLLGPPAVGDAMDTQFFGAALSITARPVQW
jgi:hypothetical protein